METIIGIALFVVGFGIGWECGRKKSGSKILELLRENIDLKIKLDIADNNDHRGADGRYTAESSLGKPF